MLRRFWLFFAQAVTVLLALMFIVVTLPQWLQRQGQLGKQLATPIVAREVAPGIGGAPATTSYAEAAQRRCRPSSTCSPARTARCRPTRARKIRCSATFRRPQRPQAAGRTGRQPWLGRYRGPEGYILTNQHVVDGADQIEVALADGRTATAKVIGSDPETDLAVLKINMTNLPTITLGRRPVAGRRRRARDRQPFGVGQTVTMGIISAGPQPLGINTFESHRVSLKPDARAPPARCRQLAASRPPPPRPASARRTARQQPDLEQHDQRQGEHQLREHVRRRDDRRDDERADDHVRISFSFSDSTPIRTSSTTTIGTRT